MADNLSQTPAPNDADSHLRLRQCRHGMMLYNLNDEYQGTMLEKYGEYSEGEVDTFRQILRPGMTAVEIGANIGSHTLPLARMVGPDGRVVAFEPQRSIFQMLCANLALNGLEQVEAHWAAVGSSPGEVLIARLNSRVRQNFGGYSIGQAGGGDMVRLLTLDSFNLPACDLIKIDVEGMEIEVIRGGLETIRRHGPPIFVENDSEEKSPALIQLLWDLDYECYWHTTPYVRVPNFRSNPENMFTTTVTTNLLCAPRRYRSNITGHHKVVSPFEAIIRTWVDSAGNLHTPEPLVSTDVEALHASALTLWRDFTFLDRALDYYERILQLRPDHATALYERACVLRKLNRREEAMAGLRAVLAVAPDHAEALLASSLWVDPC